MDCIKYLDFFTIKFNFYTNNQPKYRNVFGGIMNLIYIIICSIIFYEFSYRDLYKLNPISSKSEISNIEQKLVNIKEQKLWIPFRIVTYEEKFIDHREKLYILPYFIEGKRDNLTGMNLQYHLLNYKLCNETSMINKTNNYIIDVPLNELFCLDNNDFLFGGSWDGIFINYIEINLHLCQDGINFNSSESKCTKISDLLEYRNTSWIFEFYYPVVQFQPTNFDYPLEVIYKSYFYRLSSKANKVERLYLKEHILSDDKDIIRKNYKNISCWGKSDLYGDDYFLSEEIDPIAKGTSSRIYSLDIYMDFGFVYYTREYKKLFLIIADVFPLLRFILFFIKNITQHIKMSLTKRKLIELIFEKKTPNLSFFEFEKMNRLTHPKNNVLNSPKNNGSKELILVKNNIVSNNIDELIAKKEQNKGKEREKSLDEDKNKNKIFFSFNNKNEKQINILNKNALSKLASSKIGLMNDKKEEDTPKALKRDKKTLKKEKTFIFPLYYYLLDFYFDKLINPQHFCCISKKYFTVYNFMSQIYDISTHILLFKQFNLVNNRLKEIYEEKGFCPAHPFKKINIKDDVLIEKINNDLKKKEKSILFSKNLH